VSHASVSSRSWKATHHGEGSAGTNWAGTGNSYSLSLSRALQSAARGMAKDLKSWLAEPPPPAAPIGKPVGATPGS
jgi:hypothetical protein